MPVVEKKRACISQWHRDCNEFPSFAKSFSSSTHRPYTLLLLLLFIFSSRKCNNFLNDKNIFNDHRSILSALILAFLLYMWTHPFKSKRLQFKFSADTFVIKWRILKMILQLKVLNLVVPWDFCS